MRHIHFGRAAKGVQVVLFGMLILAMGACDDLLEVELPHLLTGDAIEGAGTAETQLNSAIALFECGYSEWATMTLGPEDAMQSIAGVGGGTHGYDHTPNTGSCDTSSSSTSWFDNIMGARALLSTAPERLVATGTGSGRGVYDRIQDEWSLGQPGERLSAIAAIYVAASIGHMGEFLCEGAIDVSDLLTPAQMLDVADDWVDRAIGHINSFGDFAMPFGVSADARNMALAIRARILWANGDLAGAAAAATTVLNDDPNFVAWVTRETGSTRRNKSFHMLTDVSFSGMLGVNTWWDGSIRSPNPATGQEWPNPIPFTGYLFLGILPDGETLVDVTDASGYFPVQWAADARDANEDPVALGNGAVADTRVPHIYKTIQGPGKWEVPAVYTAEDDDIPYMTWEELKLIQADREYEQGNYSNVIDLINDLRSDKSLPVIRDNPATGATYRSDLVADADAVRAVMIEEHRRELFAEGGRYWSYKIRNTDLLWFPRLEGSTPFQGYNLQGAVRQLFADDEYEQNPFFVERGGLDARGTGCTGMASMFGNPGSQAPIAN